MFLKIEYTDDPDNPQSRDDELSKIVGKEPSSTGTWLETSRRDLEWEFDDTEDLTIALFKLREVKGVTIIKPKYKID